MALIKYTWRHAEGHAVTDEELFPFGEDARQVLLTNVPVLKQGCELLSFHVVNPLIHEHNWKRISKQGERVYYECTHCKAEAWRRFSNFDGPTGSYNREGEYKAARWAQCRSPLKPMPVATSLFR